MVVQRDRPVDRERFQCALDTSAHRGPDHQGASYHNFTIEEASGPRTLYAALGHNRLSILDLDPRSHQPFERGETSFVYNGEIYNFRDLRGELRDLPLRTDGDTEVLLAGLQRHGSDWLSRCNGMWSFGLLDRSAGIVLAARDRYGKKPLFVYKDDRTLCLSSNIASIAAYCSLRLRMREPILQAYLVNGELYPSADETTHFEQIAQVPAGGVLTVDLSQWDMRYSRLAEEPAESPDEVVLPELLRNSARLRLVSDRRVGLLLSGGVDSTAVLSALHDQNLHETVTCFIGETGRSQDAHYARRCADQLGIDARIIELSYGAETFERFLIMCRHHEKPFPLNGNAMAMPAMYEAIAAEGVPVVVDGTGGDEIFGGYWDRYYSYAVAEAWRAGNHRWLASSLRHNRDYWGKRFKRGLKSRLKSLGRSAAEGLADPVAHYSSFDTTAALTLDPLAGFSGSLSDAQKRDAFAGRLGDWIWQNDRNAMMHGIENRSPLLDYRFSGFINLPYDRKFNGPWNKLALREAFSSLTPLPTQWRQQKQGFRWNTRQFTSDNKAAILELIRSCESLQHQVDVARFVDNASRTPRLMRGGFLSRMLAVAGTAEALSISA